MPMIALRVSPAEKVVIEYLAKENGSVSGLIRKLILDHANSTGVISRSEAIALQREMRVNAMRMDGPSDLELRVTLAGIKQQKQGRTTGVPLFKRRKKKGVAPTPSLPFVEG